MIRKNKDRKSANVTLFIMFIGIFATVLPYLFETAMMDWGFAVAFIGLVTSITCFFVFLMFNGRAKVQDRIFTGENIMVHWMYTADFWQQFNKEDLESSGVGKIFGFFFGGIFSLIGIIVFSTDTQDNGLFLLIMLAIAIFFIIIGFISSASEKKRLANTLPEAIIAREGLFFKSILYTWNNRAFSYLESVTMHPSTPSTILFVLRRLSGGTRGNIARFHQHFISIPIPPEQEQTAFEIIQFFNLPMTNERWQEMQQRATDDNKED